MLFRGGKVLRSRTLPLCITDVLYLVNLYRVHSKRAAAWKRAARSPVSGVAVERTSIQPQQPK